MGCFSWECAECGEPINMGTRATLVTPTNELLKVESYEGYGVFGGRDAYALLAEWNLPESQLYGGQGQQHDDDNRNAGISLFFDGSGGQLPIKIVCGRPCCAADTYDYNALDESPSDPDQGFNEGSYATKAEIEEDMALEDNTCGECGVDTRYEECQCCEECYNLHCTCEEDEED